ncbi:MAG: ornithine cyclodeaminase family protein [Candidatus Accumulibacter sp.]|uniref:Ornithine cyclodeaminase family protein n=1 Tax=Candidatus Accumulibacter proximus TaxID=2954385 RepID=A0A935UG00_9PROT|nr:ornithine cyclodeaminase family protein [Candidatus Accumulibacter proximus]
MPLFLREEDVKQLLSMPMALDAVESAHRALSSGFACDVPRQRTRLPQTTLHILQGALPQLDVIGYAPCTEQSIRCALPWFHLYRASSGSLACQVIAADRLGMVRTGAASGVATRWLGQARLAGGWRVWCRLAGRGGIGAIAAVCSLLRVKTRAAPGRRRPFARECQRLALEVIPAASPEEVVRGSDIVSTVTTSATPLFAAEWLSPGTHINAAGSNSLIRRELGEDVLRRCSPIVVDSVETALHEAGDLLPLLEKGRLHARQLVELGDVICGRQPGRSTAEEITVFESRAWPSGIWHWLFA